MELLLGKEISQKIKDRIIQEVESLEVKPKLVVLVNEEDSSSIGYVNSMEKVASSLGIKFEKLLMIPSESEYVSTIERLNVDPSCSAIMITRPLFKNANEKKILFRGYSNERKNNYLDFR